MEGRPSRWWYALLALPSLGLFSALLRRGEGGDGRPADDADATKPADYDELAEDTVYPPAGAPAPVA